MPGIRHSISFLMEWNADLSFFRPPGKFFTMFHFLEYPFSRGFVHIKSPDPYEAPDFDTGFMNDERDMVPMVWGYIKSRETARRMDAYAGEVQNMVRSTFCKENNNPIPTPECPHQ
jgi:alcohol oxidase